MPTVENGNDEHDVSQTNPDTTIDEQLISDENNGVDNGEDRFTDEVNTEDATAFSNNGSGLTPPWQPSGIWWNDMLYFVGPGESRKKSI